MMIFFPQNYLRTFEISTNTVKKYMIRKKFVLFCEKKLTLYNKQEFLATRSIPFEVKKKTLLSKF